jgi:hypothetical protein
MMRWQKMTSDGFLEDNWREVEGCEQVGPAQKEHRAGDGMPSFSYSRREADDHATIPLSVVPWRITVMPFESPLKKALLPITP